MFIKILLKIFGADLCAEDFFIFLLFEFLKVLGTFYEKVPDNSFTRCNRLSVFFLYRKKTRKKVTKWVKATGRSVITFLAYQNPFARFDSCPLWNPRRDCKDEASEDF